MPRIDSETFYRTSIKKYGLCAKGVHWVSKETQELRFDIILSLLPDSIDSLVDAGCGFGDFYHYLHKKKKVLNHYIGIDSLQEMCDIAYKKTSQEIIHAEITKAKLPFAEYYICSGAMNLLNSFETHLFISNCFKASKKAFIFNILCADKKSEIYNYITKQEIEKIAKHLNVSDMTMKDNYLKNDITVRFFV